MSLRDRLPPEVTLSEFEAAGEDRFRDGIALAKRGRRMGAIYMFGYVAEAILKCAFFRLLDYRLDTRISLGGPWRDDPRTMAEGDLAVAEHPEGLHNPVFWAAMIVAVRDGLAMPLRPAIQIGLLAKAQRIRRSWKVSMRYCRDRSTLADLREMCHDVAWLRTQSAELWR